MIFKIKDNFFKLSLISTHKLSVREIYVLQCSRFSIRLFFLSSKTRQRKTGSHRKVRSFCATQNCALRGHRDDGSLILNPEFDTKCFFRALLRFRVDAGDEILQEHLTSAPKSAAYISRTTPNKILAISSKIIREKMICDRVKR